MSTAPINLTPDDVDDLIYACRTDDLDWLSGMLKNWSTQMNTSEGEIIRKAIDEGENGSGSRACLLHYPAANGNLRLVQYLLEKLAETDSQSQTQSESQPQPQVNGGSSSNNTLSSHERTSLVNHQNINGNTPLHWAALNGHLEVVQALVKAGADPTIVNEAGKDAVVEAEYSAKEEAAECAAWLLKECDVLEKGTGSRVGDEGVGDGEGGGNEDENEGGQEASSAKDENLVNGKQ